MSPIPNQRPWRELSRRERAALARVSGMTLAQYKRVYEPRSKAHAVNVPTQKEEALNELSSVREADDALANEFQAIQLQVSGLQHNQGGGAG